VITNDGTLPAEREDALSRMNLNSLMKNCGVLTGSQLDEWLEGANVTPHPDHFGGFEILYGFDRHGQDFLVAKNTIAEGPHFAVIADQGK
jgi:hypothetical protein